MDTTEELQNKLGLERIKLNEPLSLHTSIKVGGPAKWYYEAQNKEEIVTAVKTANALKIPYFVLGGGTNVLFKDKGFEGLIIRNKSQNISLLGFKGKIEKGKMNLNEIMLEAESGATINQLVRYTIEENIEGLEYFLGTPGTVGGAVYNNAHWQQFLIGDKIVSAEIIDLKGNVFEVNKNYFKFGYDQSILHKTKEIVLSVKFHLAKGDKNILWQRANESLAYRKDTQPALPSLGCTFQNPHILNYSAGYLIEQTGLKGKIIGGAQISDKHANFIINLSSATSSDILSLINLIKSEVVKKFGINLKEEIVLV